MFSSPQQLWRRHQIQGSKLPTTCSGGIGRWECRHSEYSKQGVERFEDLSVRRNTRLTQCNGSRWEEDGVREWEPYCCVLLGTTAVDAISGDDEGMKSLVCIC